MLSAWLVLPLGLLLLATIAAVERVIFWLCAFVWPKDFDMGTWHGGRISRPSDEDSRWERER